MTLKLLMILLLRLIASQGDKCANVPENLKGIFGRYYSDEHYQYYIMRDDRQFTSNYLFCNILTGKFLPEEVQRSDKRIQDTEGFCEIFYDDIGIIDFSNGARIPFKSEGGYRIQTCKDGSWYDYLGQKIKDNSFKFNSFIDFFGHFFVGLVDFVPSWPIRSFSNSTGRLGLSGP